MTTEKNYYEILGVNSDASLEEIETAFQNLSEQFNSNEITENKYREILEAYLKIFRERFIQYSKEGSNNTELCEFKTTMQSALEIIGLDLGNHLSTGIKAVDSRRAQQLDDIFTFTYMLSKAKVF